MMHTFIKEVDGTYSVGYWLTSTDGSIWCNLFSKLNIVEAVGIVGNLNGYPGNPGFVLTLESRATQK